ncbi:MAG: hypothetical protein U1E51_26310 [Candidatus Binatia bacterium]|nr:hypothetical protein [Candidatus Binatia bacterium]
MSPLEIEICLHYHSSVNDMPWVVSSGAPIVDGEMALMVENGLLTSHPDDEKQKFHPTDKLHVFVAMLEETPLPVARLIDPRNGAAVECHWNKSWNAP